MSSEYYIISYLSRLVIEGILGVRNNMKYKPYFRPGVIV